MMLRLMGVVLDAGVATAWHSVRVARAGFRVCAIDNSQTM
jgi:hypothetical protein